MSLKSPKTIAFLISLLIVYSLDQLTKHWINTTIRYADRIEVIPGLFDITHARNGGGAFSFFADGPFEQRMVFFVGTTVFAIALLLVFFRKLRSDEILSATALGVVLGGALGNLTDRLRFGEVVDFLDVHLFGGYTWPTFNIADSAIVIGVILLVVEIFMAKEVVGDEARGEEDEPSDPPNHTDPGGGTATANSG
ncbi:MAG: signal peptidase II [Myxococcales bacterium]|nr:signal peptidase II [Myxococcales bacterium]